MSIKTVWRTVTDAIFLDEDTYRRTCVPPLRLAGVEAPALWRGELPADSSGPSPDRVEHFIVSGGDAAERRRPLRSLIGNHTAAGFAAVVLRGPGGCTEAGGLSSRGGYDPLEGLGREQAALCLGAAAAALGMDQNRLYLPLCDLLDCLGEPAAMETLLAVKDYREVGEEAFTRGEDAAAACMTLPEARELAMLLAKLRENHVSGQGGGSLRRGLRAGAVSVLTLHSPVWMAMALYELEMCRAAGMPLFVVLDGLDLSALQEQAEKLYGAVSGCVCHADLPAREGQFRMAQSSCGSALYFRHAPASAKALSEMLGRVQRMKTVVASSEGRAYSDAASLFNLFGSTTVSSGTTTTQSLEERSAVYPETIRCLKPGTALLVADEGIMQVRL